VLEPFFLRALGAGLLLAVAAAPLGCFVVWQRMAYVGETIAQAGLLGVALSLVIGTDATVSVLGVTLAMAVLLVLLGRQRLVPVDSLLGLLAHAALALGVIATSLVSGQQVDLMSYLFGDIFAVSQADLVWIAGGGLVVVAGLARLWQPLLAVAIHAELAAAEGISLDRVRLFFTLLLAVAIAVAMKIVGILLIIAFLIMPATAARPFAETPERMALVAVGVGAAGVAGGLVLSYLVDVPGGPAIVAVLAALAFGSLAVGRGRQ
jgi:zinc transport system permease protein